MKIVSYKKEGSVYSGLLVDGEIIEIDQDSPVSVREILVKGPEFLKQLALIAQSSKKLIGLEQVQIVAPIQRPDKLLALAGNYAKHIKEAGLKLGLSDAERESTVPRPFIKPSTTVLADGDVIPWPSYSKEIDYELELGVVIGQKAKCVSKEEALNFVAGYTIINDVSARSVTFKENRKQRPWDEFFDWLNGKWADGFCPMGPCLVTKDEIEDVNNLDMKLCVNGQIRQKGNTSEMIHKVPDIVSFVSHIMTLEPGDVIATGTPAGVAMAKGEFLQSGDKIQCSIEKIGTLTNTVGQRCEEFYQPLNIS